FSRKRKQNNLNLNNNKTHKWLITSNQMYLLVTQCLVNIKKMVLIVQLVVVKHLNNKKTKKKQIMKRWKIKDILVKSTMKFRIKLQNYNNKETMEKFHQKNLRIVILNYMIDNPI